MNDDFSFTRIYYDDDDGISGASTADVTGESFVIQNLSANDQRWVWARPYTSTGTLGNLVGLIGPTTVKDITTDDIENDAITNALIANGAVDENQINTNAVSTIKIQEDAISTTTLTEDLNNFTRSFDQNFSFTMDSAGTLTAFAYIKVNGVLSSGTDALVCRLYVDGSLSSFYQSYEESQVTSGQTLIGSESVGSGSKIVRVDVDVTGLQNTAIGPNVNLYLVVIRTYR